MYKICEIYKYANFDGITEYAERDYFGIRKFYSIPMYFVYDIDNIYQFNLIIVSKN